MARDIHLLFEKKNKEGKWERIEIPDFLIPNIRDYHLFSFLADVGSGDCWPLAGQFNGRRIPEDCSFKQDFENRYIHYTTYAYLDELLRLPWQEAALNDCYFIAFCRYVLTRLLGYNDFSHEEKRAIRVVMGFDS